MTNDPSEQKSPVPGEEQKRSVSKPISEEGTSVHDEKKETQKKETLRPVGRIQVSLPRGGEMATKHFVVPCGPLTAWDSQENVKLSPGKGEIQISFPGRSNSKGVSARARQTDAELAAGDQLLPQNPKIIGLNSASQTYCKADRKKLEAERKAETERLAREAEAARKSETERLAREAEAARKSETERLAREAEAARKSETERLAREAEAARKSETERLAREAEAARKSETERLAREAEAARKSELESGTAEIPASVDAAKNMVSEEVSGSEELKNPEEREEEIGSVIQEEDNWFVRYLIRIGETVSNWLFTIGDFVMFATRVFFWLLRLPRRGTLLPCMYEIGIMSLPVIALTGTFIGMVLAVQSYNQLKGFYLETRMGALINLSLVRELGPVLAATMLAGRIGSSMAAELGTMRVTEQIDALGSMGVNPIHYLVVPRFMACVMLIPVLTIFADFMGIVGGAYFSVWVYGIDWHFYLTNSNKIVGEPDIFIGIFKSFFFGATIGLIGCHRGFNSRPGAQGVGRASTEAFVFSFVFILLLDLALGTIFESLDGVLFTKMPRQL